MHVEGGGPRYDSSLSDLLIDECIFVSESSPCEFCRTRNGSGPSPCIKKWGKKKEEALSRGISTAFADIPSHDILLLQYCYSEAFERSGGVLIARLLQKFAAVFGSSIDSKSLRHAILAYATAVKASDCDREITEQ